MNKSARRAMLRTAAAEDCRPSHYISYARFFQELYKTAKNLFDDYSYLQFSDDLGFGLTTYMHQVSNGHRPFTGKACEKFLRLFPLDPKERRYLRGMVDYGNARDKREADERLQTLLAHKQAVAGNPLTEKQLEYFAHWYNPLIRELAATEFPGTDSRAIAGLLEFKLPEAKIRRSLDLLMDLGFIVRDQATGQPKQAATAVNTGSQVAGVALRSYHSQLIDLARESLRQVEGSRRDISAITIKCTREGFSEIQALIHELQSRIMELAAKWDEHGDQVYQLNLQLFPLTRRIKGKPTGPASQKAGREKTRKISEKTAGKAAQKTQKKPKRVRHDS